MDYLGRVGMTIIIFIMAVLCIGVWVRDWSRNTDAVGRFFRMELFPALGEISSYHAYLTFYEYKEKPDSQFFTMKADLILRNVHGLDMTDPKNIRVFDDHEIEFQESLNPYTMLGYGSNAMLAATRKKIASFVRGLSMSAGLTGWHQYR